ncbi:hypothetical protein [Actinoallomurus sp. NPDC050550]|uniref:hypothetical protein n=1 Tax=Actinoallomurus sp. NPDC050550 TaxID=3154937 RepID=UPI0033DC119D
MRKKIIGRNERPKCAGCNGQGGWWEHSNGQPGKAKPKKWIKCNACNGTGHK